jgi:uncharacterized protein YcbX
MAPLVTGLAITPVKGTRLRAVQQVELGSGGARGDRRFFLIDGRDRMVNAKQLGELLRVQADFDVFAERLMLEFPDGSTVSGRLVPGAPVEARFFSRIASGVLVEGPWAEALSSYLGQPVRLVDAGSAVDRGPGGAASLISRASLARLASVAGAGSIDSRRFRMLVEIDGVAAHAEDGWVGQAVRLGEAGVRFGGNVGRCLVTSRHPDTGNIDVPTLDLLGEYRRGLESTEPLPFGIYGEVVRPGPVRVGDAVGPEN